MPWVLLVFIGAILNVFVNYGYKVTGAEGGIAWIAAGAMGCEAIVLITYTLLKRKNYAPLMTGKTPLAIAAMGAGVCVCFLCFLHALATGPISIIDPMWVCIYALTSILIGMVIIRERPAKTALLGVALYLAGAVLMGWGGTQ